MRPIHRSRITTHPSAARAAVLFALGALLLEGEARAQTDVLWRRTVPSPIEFTRLDSRGHLLIVTESGITALDPDSGSQVWHFPFHRPIRVFREPSTDRLLVGGGRAMAALELESGALVWGRSDLPDLEQTSVITDRRDSIAILQSHNGFTVLDLATGVTAWDSTALPPGTIVREYFRLNSLGLLLLIAKTPSSDVTLIAVTIHTGEVRWSDTELLRNKVKFKRNAGVEYAILHPLVFLPDSTVVLYLSTDGPLRLDPRTGEVLWRSTALTGAPVPTFDDGYPRSRLLDSLLIVPSRSHLIALEIGTGKARWSATGHMPNRPNWLEVDSNAIVTGSFGGRNSFVSVLGTEGTRRRPTDWRIADDARGLLLGDTLYLSSKDQLYALPLDTGIERSLASIGFQGGESPVDIDSLADGGLVLMGRQNLARINRDGTVVYRRFYPSPAPSFWTRVSAAAASVNRPNYAWSAGVLDYFYIFTAKPDTTGQKGFSLVGLDRRDGRELGRMWFDKPDPGFLLDGRSGTVYELEGKSEIIARRFPGLPALEAE
jgi:outer membrane protein assembly factor BamB